MQELKGAKMNWKNRLTNYNFWISIFSAVLLILQALKIEFDIAYVNEIFTAVLGLLVVIGIISDPTRTTTKQNSTPTIETKLKSSNEKIEEKPSKQNVVEEQKNELPFDEKDETYNVDTKNDIQAIMTKITTTLDDKLNELTQFNFETLSKIKQAEFSEEKKNEIQINDSTIKENSLPAVAEMINPYIDVIN